MKNPQINLTDMQAWVSDERQDAPKARQKLLDTLGAQLANEKKQTQPDQLRPGTPERLVAESRQRRISTLAQSLGYQPPGAEFGKELGKELLTHVTGIPLTTDSQIKLASEVGKTREIPKIGRTLKSGRDLGNDFELGF